MDRIIIYGSFSGGKFNFSATRRKLFKICSTVHPLSIVTNNAWNDGKKKNGLWRIIRHQIKYVAVGRLCWLLYDK